MHLSAGYWLLLSPIYYGLLCYSCLRIHGYEVWYSVFLAAIRILSMFSCYQSDEVSNPKRYKLLIDVATRWNSSYYMVKRYLEIHAAVYASLTKLQVAKFLCLLWQRPEIFYSV